MNKAQSTHDPKMRKNERGAALITSLLISTLLLVAGGALIQITSMSTANTVDATAETQAYYGAEAGLQAGLNALRVNAAHTGSALPTGMTTINFRTPSLQALPTIARMEWTVIQQPLRDCHGGFLIPTLRPPARA